MFYLIRKINSFYWKISNGINRKHAWMYRTALWMTTIYLLSYIIISSLIIGGLILIFIFVTSLLLKLYEYLIDIKKTKTATSILIIGVLTVSVLLSFTIYNYYKINDWVITTAKEISESTPLSKRGLTKDILRNTESE